MQKYNSEVIHTEKWEAFDITQPTLSHHMKILCDCGLVSDRKDGKWHHYSINTDIWNKFSDFIRQISEV